MPALVRLKELLLGSRASYFNDLLPMLDDEAKAFASQVKPEKGLFKSTRDRIAKENAELLAKSLAKQDEFKATTALLAKERKSVLKARLATGGAVAGVLGLGALAKRGGGSEQPIQPTQGGGAWG